MVISTSPAMTLEEYLEYEPETDGRYELRQGQLITMGAESDVNVSIAMFLISVLLKVVPYSQLRRGTEIAVQRLDILICLCSLQTECRH